MKHVTVILALLMPSIIVSAQEDNIDFPSHRNHRPCSIEFSPDGNLFVTRVNVEPTGYRVRVWNWHGGIGRYSPGARGSTLLHVLSEDYRDTGTHPVGGCAVAISPDSKYLATTTRTDYGTREGVDIYDLGTGALVKTVPIPVGPPEGGHRHPTSVESISFSPSGKLLAVGTWRRGVRGAAFLLNIEDGTGKWVHIDSGYSVSFHPNGKEFVVVSGDQGSGAYTIVFDVETGYPIRRWNACYNPGDNRRCDFFYYDVKQAVHYSTSGDFIIALTGYGGPSTYDVRGMLTVRDAITGEIETTARIGTGYAIMYAHPARDLLLVGTGSGATLYELTEGAKLVSLGQWGGNNRGAAQLYAREYLTFTPDGQDMILSIRDTGGLWQQTLYPKLEELKNQTYALNKPIKPLEFPRFEGGVPPITYTLAPVSMPPGLFYDPENRRIIGVPTSVGSWEYTYTAEDSGGLSDSIEISIGANKVNFSINVVMPTFVDDVPSLDELRVYPTPTTDAVTFTQDGHVEIFDMIGRKVLDSKIRNGMPLPVGQLPAGLYLYSFLSREGMDRQTGKLIMR